MVLPPLELFSLRKELPCCRAALSVLRHRFERDAYHPGDSGAASVHLFPQDSHSHELQASTLSRVGSSALHSGHLGNSNSGVSWLDSSMISCGIGCAAISRASSSWSAATNTRGPLRPPTNLGL